MKKVLTLCAVVGALGCGGADAGQPLADDMEDEVASFLASYLLALETRDVDLLRTLYVDGRPLRVD